MKTIQHESEAEDHFDMLPYIAILMCVLGCLLLVAMSFASLSLRQPPKPLVSEAAAKKLFVAQTNLAAIKGEVRKARQKVQEKAAELSLAQDAERLRQKIADLDRQKMALDEKVTRERLNAAEIQKLKAQIASVEKERDECQRRFSAKDDPSPPADPRLVVVRRLHGQYVLVECVEKAAVVYPGQRRIALPTTEAELGWLRGRIQEVGGVVVIARPSGFEGTFPKLQEVVTELAVDHRNIKFSFWPLKDNESLTPYLPKGKQS